MHVSTCIHVHIYMYIKMLNNTCIHVIYIICICCVICIVCCLTFPEVAAQCMTVLLPLSLSERLAPFLISNWNIGILP